MDEPTETPPTDAEKLARLISESLASGHAEGERVAAEHRWRATTEHMEGMEAEMVPHMAKLFGKLLEDPNVPPELRHTLETITDPKNQFGFIVQVMAWLGAILGAMPQLGAIWMRPVLQNYNTQNLTMTLSPADASDAVVRGILNYEGGLEYANQSGIGPEVFEVLVGLTGEPPGPMDMLSLWRRGLMTEDELDQSILFSRLKDQYVPFVKELAHSYMSPVDVVNLLIKDLVDHDTAQTMFGVAGGIEDQFDLLYQSYGNSIGPASAMNMWNHGLIDETQVDTVLARSRINPMFYDIAKLQRHKFLQAFQISAVAKTGLVDPQTLITWMVQDGYSAEQADAYVGALESPTTKAKSETEAMIVAQYHDGLLDTPTAMTLLTEIGYTAEVAGLILGVEDQKVVHEQRNNAIAAVKAGYEAGHITKATALSDLSTLGVPLTARNQWVSDWDVAASAKVKVFTAAEVGRFAKEGLLTRDEAIQRWRSMGYSSVDATLLADSYLGLPSGPPVGVSPPPVPPPPPPPPT